MEVNEEGVKWKSEGEIAIMTENQRKQQGGGAAADVVISVFGDEKEPKSDAVVKEHPKIPTTDHDVISPEIARLSPSPNRPPKIQTTETLITRGKTLSRSVYSKPKSRFGEKSVALDSNMFDENVVEERVTSTNAKLVDASVGGSNRNIPITPKTPLMASPGPFGGVDDEHEEIYKRVSSRKKLKYRKVRAKVLIEWFLFLCILGCLIASLTVKQWKNVAIWGLQVWEWCVLVLVTFCGLLFTRWLMSFVVLLIELKFLLNKNVLYFVHGMKNSVQVSVWLSLVLITWISLFHEGTKRSRLTHRVLDFITWTIATLLIGSLLWLIKTLLLKILASSFHVNTFFDRIQESLFHQHILFTLSGRPVMELEAKLGESHSNTSRFMSVLVAKKGKKGKEKKEKVVIDMNEIHQMKHDKVTALTMKTWVDLILNSRLETLSSVINEGRNEQVDEEIKNEEEAMAAAYHIFRNVAQPACKFIEAEDLKRFMIKEEVDIIFPMIDVAEAGHIDRKTLNDWVVKVYKDRKALAHALNDTKSAVKQLDKIVIAILTIAVIIVWFLLTGVANTKVLLFLSSQLVVAVFIFGNTCKTIFEAIIFVFVMHPFDVGDRCVIDGVQMIVEEMNILTTVFLRFDHERISYPNSVLATKPISNFYRSPDNMGDALEFSIDFRTPLGKIGTLKEKIKKYVENNPQNWQKNHDVVVKEIENVNKLKMVLFFNHTMNFQDFVEKMRRRSELLLELKKIFEDLNIRYDLLPQEVHLNESKAAGDGTRR